MPRGPKWVPNLRTITFWTYLYNLLTWKVRGNFLIFLAQMYTRMFAITVQKNRSLKLTSTLPRAPLWLSNFENVYHFREAISLECHGNFSRFFTRVRQHCISKLCEVSSHTNYNKGVPRGPKCALIYIKSNFGPIFTAL